MTKTKLIPPCTYQGGKQRYAKQIVDIIFEENEINAETKFYDLCCGSGSITLELISRGVNPKNITMIDKSMWGMFYKQVGDGTFDTDVLREHLNNIPSDKFLVQDYMKSLAERETDDNDVYTYLLLQASSFGGKQIDMIDGEWKHHGFRSYWQPTETSARRSPVNPMQPTQDELLKRVCRIVEECKGVNAVHDDILNVEIEQNENTIVYIDPPYMNTTSYNHDIDIVKLCESLRVRTYVSESVTISERNYDLQLVGAKGGITAKKNSRTKEVLNVFN